MQTAEKRSVAAVTVLILFLFFCQAAVAGNASQITPEKEAWQQDIQNQIWQGRWTENISSRENSILNRENEDFINWLYNNRTVNNRQQTNQDKTFVSITIEQKDEFKAISNPDLTPGHGKRFVSYLVSIRNTSAKPIYGGSSDPHASFEIVTVSGYVIQAENTSSQAWKDNRMVWNAGDIPPGEVRKGWVVFSVPENDNPKHLTFHVAEIVEPHSTTKIGSVSVPLN